MSRPTLDPRRVPANWLALALAAACAVPWSATRLLGGQLPAPATATLAGLAILGAAFLLSWAVEAAELDVPPAVAVSVLALVAVLPEYAVDATFAWKAAHDPRQAHYAVANMTGGNRLLLGLGWSAMVFIAWGRFGKRGIRLPDSARVDVGVLLGASLYALLPVALRRLSLADTVVLVGIYVFYVVGAGRVSAREHHAPVLAGPSALLGALGPRTRWTILLGLLAWSAGAIYLAAEPFAESLVHTGLRLGIDEFLLVQWLAPLASEAPELVVAALLVARGRLDRGMLTLVSSKVNQWTLLIGTLPLVTSISAGAPTALPLDHRQQEEVFLTAAQSLFGVAVLSNLELGRGQAVLLFVLFAAQFLVPGTRGRVVFAGAYLAAALGVLLFDRVHREGLVHAVSAAVRAPFRGRT